MPLMDVDRGALGECVRFSVVDLKRVLHSPIFRFAITLGPPPPPTTPHPAAYRIDLEVAVYIMGER